MDPGTEFKGQFTEQCLARGILVLPTDPRAPWQNGKTERAGKAWKGIFKNALRKDKPLDFEEWRLLGHECNASRNRYHNRSGFSPMQRVFGMSHRLPSSLLSDDVIDPVYCFDSPNHDFHRSEQLRRMAVRAFARLDCRERLGKALRARHRTVENVTEGQLVYVYRQPKVGRGWYVGPGVVILPTSGGAWVNMKGSLWRCANEQMRSATNEENMGIEVVSRYLGNLRENLQTTRGARKYLDVTREGAPRFHEGDDADEEALEEGDDVLPGPEEATASAAAAAMEEQFRLDEIDLARANQAPGGEGSTPTADRVKRRLDLAGTPGTTPEPTQFPWPSPAGWTPSSGSRAVPPHLETPSSNKRVKSESSIEQLHNTACDGNKFVQIFVPDYNVALESLDTWENMIPSKYHNYYLNRRF